MLKPGVLAAGALYAALVWAPLAWGAHRGLPLAITELLVLAGALVWFAPMAARGRIVWRASALDRPLLLLIALVLVQLAIGNGPLVRWALSAAPTPLPERFWAVGTVAPLQTARSLLLLLTYAGVYVLVVNLVRTRAELWRLVHVLVALGGVLAFAGLLDYLGGANWLVQWRDHPFERRVAGTFVNPDHFASWLGMGICLGLGSLLARAGRLGPLRPLLASRHGRDRLMRRLIPAVGIAVMALALVFTLSRGGVLSLLLALAALLAALGRLGRARRSLVVVGASLVAILGYSAWIGLGPLIERVRAAPYDLRLIQGLSSLPLLGAFPLWGVGLGAYREAYPRYEPLALDPGRVYWPFAHDDLLQLAIELGVVGAGIAAFAAWRVVRDLCRAHLFGGGACPVGAGEAEGARRNEATSVGVGLGGLSGALVLVIHSAFDYGARIPANGMLGAACLGLATVALHTRFAPAGDRFLARTRAVDLPSRAVRAAIAAVSVGAACVAAAAIAWPPLVQAWVEAAPGPAVALRRLDRALAVVHADPQALDLRARLRLAAARRVWEAGETGDGPVLASWDARRAAAASLLDGAQADCRAAIALVPTNPLFQETLGWVHATRAAIADGAPAAELAQALTAMERAVALQPENAQLYRSLAVVALDPRVPRLEAALAASRAAIARSPDLLPDLAGRLVLAGLPESDWPRAVPASTADRVELAALLGRYGLARAAIAVYEDALAGAAPSDEPLVRFMLADLLIRRADPSAALAQLDAAAARDPESAEIQLARARALARLGDPAALAAHRAALERAEARDAVPGGPPPPFARATPRARAAASEALGPGGAPAAAYRRALAQYLTDRQLWPQALEQWDRLAADAPADASAQAGRARALDAQGDRERAIAAYRRAVELDPRGTAVRARLARALWDTDQYYQAVNEWRAVIEQQPGDVDARLALAQAYARLGERALATEEYHRILLIAPGQADALRGLARLRG